MSTTQPTAPAGDVRSATVADVIITGASVYTLDAARRWAEAIAIAGGRIVAVGTDDQIRDLAGPGTHRLHLPGRMIVPGFQDAHVHAPFGGRYRFECELHDRHGADDYRETIARYAREHPDEPWITGGGWTLDSFPGGTPSRQELDAIVSDRPAFLMNTDVHSAWANTRALQIAGIDRETPDPWDGRIERDPATGDPQGTLHEGAYTLVQRHIPPPTTEQWEQGILEAQRYLHSLGITAWQDAWVTPDTLPAYRSLDDRGALTARVVASLWWDRYRGLEQIDDLIDRSEWGTGGRVRATTVKIMQDGVPESYTAAMLEPYLDAEGRPTGNRGLSYLDPELLRSAVTALDGKGLQVHVHAIGDRAVRDTLDAMEAALRANGRRDARHHITHLQVVHPDDHPRFRELGVVATVQPLWACYEDQMLELTIPFLGPERASRQYAFGSLRRVGATMAFASDWSVSSPDPLLGMEVAVTRVDPENRDNEPLCPQEGLDLPSALEAYTMGSAFVNHLDADTGSIEAGKAADLVVLDRNLFDLGGEIGDARVVLTMVDGRVVYATADIEEIVELPEVAPLETGR